MYNPQRLHWSFQEREWKEKESFFAQDGTQETQVPKGAGSTKKAGTERTTVAKGVESQFVQETSHVEDMSSHHSKESTLLG